MPAPKTALREEARRLRAVERLSNAEIHKRLDEAVNLSTVTRWLRDVPLSRQERSKKISDALTRDDDGDPSTFWKVVDIERLPPGQKGRIAEAAVSFRCSLYGLDVFVSPHDGDPADRVVRTPEGKLKQLQVRWCSRPRGGSPLISLRSFSNGKSRQVDRTTFDYLVGYDLYTDTAYVFTSEETEGHASAISVREDAREAWHKILGAMVK